MSKFKTHDEAAIAQYVWKNPIMRKIAYRVLKRALACDSFWPDTIDFSDISQADKNCIGSTFMSLSKLGLIIRTGTFKSSSTEDSKGRTIFEYQIDAPHLASALLKRMESQGIAPPPETVTQGELL